MEESYGSSVVARKLRYLGHIMRKEDENLEKYIITGTVEGTRGKGRPRRAWSDEVNEWTNLSTEEMLQLTKDRAACRSLVYRVAMFAPANKTPTTTIRTIRMYIA